ncbi:MAG: rhomboid family intramembrane serine protease [Bacteroidia bacterium]|nr:rhomboid family intramembrane serine protease [Bacteroidia bacterium]
MKLTYNAPVVLTFSLISTLVLLVDTVTGCSEANFMDCTLKPYFMTRGVFDFGNPMDYFRLVSSTMGHANWAHLLGNFSIILLIGPMLEEKFGSLSLLFMMVVTAIITAILDIMFWDHGGLGASGIVFMMILLSSFTNFKSGTIPLTFILVVILFIGQEVVRAFQDDNISQFAHILGGIFGAIFGFISGPKQVSTQTATQSKPPVNPQL